MNIDKIHRSNKDYPLNERTDVMELMSTLVHYGLENEKCKVSIRYFENSGKFTIERLSKNDYEGQCFEDIEIAPNPKPINNKEGSSATNDDNNYCPKQNLKNENNGKVVEIPVEYNYDSNVVSMVSSINSVNIGDKITNIQVNRCPSLDINIKRINRNNSDTDSNPDDHNSTIACCSNTSRDKRARRRQIIRNKANECHDQYITSKVNEKDLQIKIDTKTTISKLKKRNRKDNNNSETNMTMYSEKTEVENNAKSITEHQQKENNIIKITTVSRAPSPQYNKMKYDETKECQYKLGVGVLGSDSDLVQEFSKKLNSRDKLNYINGFEFVEHNPPKKIKFNNEPIVCSSRCESINVINAIQNTQSQKWIQNIQNGLNNFFHYICNRI